MIEAKVTKSSILEPSSPPIPVLGKFLSLTILIDTSLFFKSDLVRLSFPIFSPLTVILDTLYPFGITNCGSFSFTILLETILPSFPIIFILTEAVLGVNVIVLYLVLPVAVFTSIFLSLYPFKATFI